MNTRRGFLNTVAAILGLSATYVSDKHIGRLKNIEDKDKFRDNLSFEDGDFNINMWTNFKPSNRKFQHIVRTTINIDRDRYMREVDFDYGFHEQILRTKEDPYISEILDRMRENLKLEGLLTRKNFEYESSTYTPRSAEYGEQKTDDEIRRTKDRVFEDWFLYYVKMLGQWNIDYEVDGSSAGQIGYSRHPLESLVDGVGDCKDSTILMFSMLSHNEFDVGYASLPGHVGLLVNKKHIEHENADTWYESGNDKYTFVEPNEKEDFGEHREFNRDDLIVAWTEKYGFDKLDITNIPNHISKGSDIVTESFVASFQ
jgi:hypothetical protein